MLALCRSSVSLRAEEEECFCFCTRINNKKPLIVVFFQ